jgi:hypothetical protein
MKQDLGPLGQIDFLTDPELKASLGHSMSNAIREWYRGIDYMGFAGNGNGTNTFTVPAFPDSGYSWNYKLVSAQLAAAGTLSIYPGEVTTIAPIGVVTAIANGTNFDCVFRWGSNQCVLKDQRAVTLLGSAVILNWRLMVEQVPTEMQGKF